MRDNQSNDADPRWPLDKAEVRKLREQWIRDTDAFFEASPQANSLDAVDRFGHMPGTLFWEIERAKFYARRAPMSTVLLLGIVVCVVLLAASIIERAVT